MVRSYQRHFQDLPRNLKLFLVGHAVMAFGNSVHALLFNLFLREQGLKEGVMGSLAATTSLGVALMAFPAAFVLERFAVKPLLITGLVVSTLAYLAQVTAPTVELYTLFGLLGAMGLAVFNISVSPFIFRHTRIEQRVYAFTMNAAAVMGAQLVGFTIGGRLPQFLNELGMAAAGAASLKLAMALSLSCTFLALVPMSQILRAPVPRNRKPLLQGLADKDWSTIGKLMAPKVAIALGAGMIFPFMNVYLTSKFNLGAAAVGQAFGVLQLCMFFGITISPLMLRRFDRLRFMMYTALLSVPFMLTMAFATSVGLVLGAFFIRGMLMNMSAPMTSLFEMEKVKEADCLFASSVLIFCYNTAWTISTQLGGWIIEAHGFHVSFIAAATLYLTAVAFYWYFFRRSSAEATVCDSTPAQAA